MIILLYFLIGIFVGLLSGLLGLGGGVIIVPALAAVFVTLHFPEAHLMNLATGTSLATICLTSLMTTWSQNRQGSVVWSILKWFIPGMMAGSIVGVWLGKQISTQGLNWIFGIFCFVMALQMLFRGGKDISPNPQTQRTSIWLFLVLAFVAGISSGILGVGGGVILIPMFLWIGLQMPQASACSAACAVPTALMGTLSAMMVGWHSTELPPQALGFIFWPAALGIGVVSVLTAPLGVYLSHHLPVPVIKRIFGGILLIVAWRMIPW